MWGLVDEIIFYRLHVSKQQENPSRIMDAEAAVITFGLEKV
jgi:hypothetical protein